MYAYSKKTTIGWIRGVSTKRVCVFRLMPMPLLRPQRQRQQHHPIRFITTRTAAALRLLDIPRAQEHTLTMKQLRHAYFAAAKKCHPDTNTQRQQQQEQTTNADKAEKQRQHADFLELTAAYELLARAMASGGGDQSDGDDGTIVISPDEEADFRAACELQLGVSAEIVEECKQSPLFRTWLAGRTDSAHTWRDFLRKNGGLAPKLPSVAGQLPAGGGGGGVATPRLKSRRKRR